MHGTSPHTPLSGKDNSTVKRLRALSDAKQRKKEGAFLIEGVKMVEEAVRDNLGVRMIAASPSLVRHHGRGILKLAESRQIGIVWISEKLMEAVSENRTPQPVMAVVNMRHSSEEELFTHPAKLVVMAHQLQDPGNLGTIIRTTEAAGASGIACTAGTVDPYNPKAIRASMGSILRLPVIPVPEAAGFIEKCRQAGFQAVATLLSARQTAFDVDFTKPTVMIVGQEGSGLPEDVIGGIDLQVRIPMAETIDSLNVATAAAVLLYEALRQRTRGTRS